jgi:hypothetical protein
MGRPMAPAAEAGTAIRVAALPHKAGAPPGLIGAAKIAFESGWGHYATAAVRLIQAA